MRKGLKEMSRYCNKSEILEKYQMENVLKNKNYYDLNKEKNELLCLLKDTENEINLLEIKARERPYVSYFLWGNYHKNKYIKKYNDIRILLHYYEKAIENLYGL